MRKDVAAEIDISAIISTYVYMDNQSADYYGKDLDWILDNMPDPVKSTSEYKAVYDAVHAEGSTLGKLKLVSQSMVEKYDDEMIIACAFKDSNGNIYVSYRGTGDGKWVDNGQGIASESSLMQEVACEYFDGLVEKLHLDTYDKGKIIVTGHSKGGNEAQYVTLESEYGYLIDNCYSIDGQGFSEQAIKHFKEQFGEEYYYSQLEKMYSINGENDYVHDLGIVVIPEENTYFIETSGEKGVGDFHNIIFMLSGTGLNWKTDEYDNIISVEQGVIGKFVKALSQKMRYLDQEDLEDCAMTVMSLIETFMPYNGIMGGSYLEGVGGAYMTYEEYLGFLAHGIPLLAETLLLTEEGRAMLYDLLRKGVEAAYDKHGVMGVVAAAFISIIAVPIGCLILGGASLIANIFDLATDFIDKIKGDYAKLKAWLADLKKEFVNIVNKAIVKLKSLSYGYKYASANPKIVVNTYKLDSYAQRLRTVNNRIARLDQRLDALYKSAGLLDLWKLMSADILTGYSWRLLRCASYLNKTADDFCSTENKLIKKL